MTPTWEDGTEPLVGGGLVQAGKVDRQVRAALAAAKEVQPTGDHKSFLSFMGLPESFFYELGKEPSSTELPQATAFSPEVMSAAHDAAVQQFGNTSRDLALEKEIIALEAKVRDYEAALKDIIDWNEGLGYPRISLYPNQGQCYSAKVAQAALAKHGGAA